MTPTKIREILKEICRGVGPYSQDALTHAGNCIENMKKLASDGLNNLDKFLIELEKLKGSLEFKIEAKIVGDMESQYWKGQIHVIDIILERWK